MWLTVLSAALAEDSPANGVSTFSGRLVRAALRFPAGHFANGIALPGGESVERVLVELNDSGMWKRFSYKDKREFTLIALLYSQLEGGEAVILLQMLGSEARQVASDLALINDEALRDKVGLSPRGIERYRNRVAFLRTERPITSKAANLRFTYYLNPTPNDRNVEFDPKRNLFTNLKSDERVTAP